MFLHFPGGSGYSPLKNIVLLTWKIPYSARFLRSAAEVEGAIQKGEVAVEKPGVVENMPFLTWSREANGKLPMSNGNNSACALVFSGFEFGVD